MTPKNYIIYQYEKLSKALDRKPTKDEFYQIVKKESVEEYFPKFSDIEEESRYYSNGKKDLAEQLLKLHKELGAVPTQEEFCQVRDRYYVRRYFSSYNDLVKYVGLTPNKEYPKKVKECKQY